MKQAPKPQLLALTIATLFASGLANAQTAPADDDSKATVVVTGTRVANRTALDTASPVDIISQESLKNVGTTEINQALAVALPSLNFPRPGLTDGTDTVRPATLAGLAPDQTLVLVNSKRRHAASLVNVNGSIGRGSAAVDMNSIPSGIVKSIEVLRSGASAQYGSDAIAGVVNVRLRQDKSGGEATLTYGLRPTEYNIISDTGPADKTWNPGPNSRRVTDGQTGTFSLWKGFELGADGYLTVAAEYKDQSHTERSGYDMRQQYPKVGTAYDPRELTINRWNAWYGEPEMKQSTVFANAGMNLAGGAKFYGWASYQRRDATSAGFFRRALQDQNIISIYPDGYLPLINPTVDDYSAHAGYSWTAGAWDMDASVGYGKNKMSYTILNTLNRSIGPSSKTQFDAGGFAYDQLTFNLSGVRQFDAGLASPLNVAVGAEARREGYEIFAGEPDSYRNGGVLLSNGTPAPSGAQVFPGFRPENVTDISRSAIGAYVDLEANLSKNFLGSAAIRAEHYSDFGNSVAGKLGGRYDFSKEFALRGSVQNGFRAPSLQQQGFTTTSTNFINGVPFEITTFRPSDKAAIALGAKPLEAEKSTNLSFGAVARIGDVSLTADAYRIKIKNRIVLSENLTAANVRAFLTAQGFIGVGGGRFFINGVDTSTRGLDVVASLPLQTSAGRFDFTAAANYVKTSVDKVPSTSQLSALSPAPILFDRNNVLTFERGSPKSKYVFTTTWKEGNWGATGRATRYGEVLSPGTTAAADFILTPKWVFDVEGRYSFSKALSLAVGADNVFDNYPDPLPPNLNTTGNTSYSNYSPFGRSGRFVYGRLNYKF
ncbi:TonB-dependent siderophore receptor [Massilia sp. TS11]|uniref:TonB-dependent receptor plug domain-containing protein n=1 Tax=Massilia sp. TS11 TaxID=2908003 RepID=UPI001EDBBA03|nr:TonB-dependent receptor [Massilia sp. TS11]MCG2585203.1 TonB-dependent receptor [Massilia sp. TS11]